MKHVVMAAAVLVMATTLAWAEEDGQSQPGAGGGHRGPGAGNFDEHFAKMDKNGNGVIDRDEFHGPTNLFDRIDTDHSGTLSKDELKTFHAQHRPGPGNLDEHFKEMDKNGNGVIDKDEFRGPPELFAKIDTDNSGTLSKEELKAFHAQRHAHGGAAAQTNAQPAAACETKAK